MKDGGVIEEPLLKQFKRRMGKGINCRKEGIMKMSPSLIVPPLKIGPAGVE